MSSVDPSKKVPPEYRLVSEDRRRGRVRLTPFAILSGCVVLLLAVAFIVYGVRQLVLASAPLEPIATATATATTAAVGNITPTPEVSPAAGGCPTDPAQWRLVPYSFSDAEGEQTYYMIDPPCVMEAAEQAYRDYIDARADHGARWTPEDMVYFFSPFTYTLLLTGEQVPARQLDRMYFCADLVKDDGSPVTSADIHVIFFTVSMDGRVAELLTGSGGFARTMRLYDCWTGEVLSENRTTGETGHYRPMVYNPALGRWQLGIKSDLSVRPSEEGGVSLLVSLIAGAQGRSRP